MDSDTLQEKNNFSGRDIASDFFSARLVPCFFVVNVNIFTQMTLFNRNLYVSMVQIIN